MDYLLWGRVLERVMAVAIGGLSIWLGYRLFLKIPRLRSGEAKLALPGDISLYFTRVGPGVFFSLFGAAVVVTALRAGLMMEGTLKAPYSVGAPGNPASPAQGVELTQRVGYASAAMAAEDPARLAARRADARRSLAELNGVLALLPASTAAARRLDVGLALRDAKLALLQQVWSPAWGEFASLVEWSQHETAGAPAGGVHPEVLALWRQPRP